MQKARWTWCCSLALAGMGVLLALGCHNTPIDVSEYVRGPAPLRMPSPAATERCDCYEDSLTGGQVFAMYCGYCHNAPPLAERPFASYRNVAAHMRVRANLTGKEYAKLMEFLRRWHDIPPPHPPVEPSPKRFIYSQPIPELKPAAKPPVPLPPPQPKPGDDGKQPKGQE
ncbi:MAG TPA: hypothetical protein VG013_00465 [Gemmataceae bacterium]|jgi:hypothetical protein|nr:hypothetical protein [Gemmataceae bacterium]